MAMEGYYKVEDGTEIYVESDLVDEPVANLIINHGFAEHCSRYDYVAEEFNSRSISVYRYDLRGHGRTKSKQGHVDSFFDFTKDLDQLVDKIKEDDPNTPLFMLGHSMGGFISCLYGIDHKDKLRGQIFSGPAVLKANQVKGLKGTFLGLVSRFLPKLMIRNVLTDDICSDRRVVADYMEDPMILSHATAKLLNEFQIKGVGYIEENIGRYDYPCFISHGEKDNIISKDASVFLYNSISSKDKEIKIYDDLFHEILNEKNKDEIIKDMSNWIYDRLD